MKLPHLFRRKPSPPPPPVPIFAQIELAPSRLKKPAILIAVGVLLAYFGCPQTQAPPKITGPFVAPPVQPTYVHAPEPEPKKEQKERVNRRRNYKIYTGPRGGRYHLSASGKNVYERKK